jgi:signal transduction histidine kinase
MKGLRKRLAVAFISIASGTVILSVTFLVLATIYHYHLYRIQTHGIDANTVSLDRHFGQAMVQSTILAVIGAVTLAVFTSLFVSKRITKPLIQMRQAAEQMIQGDLNTRIPVKGNDELSDLAQALNHLTEELQKQEALRKNLTSDVAHELRTPLATLKSHMEAFLDGVWEPTNERIRSCYEEIERLTRLVGDLEKLTALEAPGFQLHRKRENIQDIAEQAVRSAQASFLQKGVTLRLHAPESVLAMVDRTRILQILANLLSNALKFTPKGGEVKVEVRNDGTDALLIVQDNGIGIPPSEVPKVFERFYRVEKSRNRKLGGSGIGLTIVKKLTQAHEGDVEIKSKEGKGTTVYVRIPKSNR